MKWHELEVLHVSRIKYLEMKIGHLGQNEIFRIGNTSCKIIEILEIKIVHVS